MFSAIHVVSGVASISLPELVWQIRRGTQYICEVHKSVILAYLLEVLLIVYSFHSVANWKMKNLVELYPPIVKLNSLLGRPTCEEQKHLSEDFIYLHY